MTYVNLLFSPAAPPPTILTFLDGSSERNLRESVKEVTLAEARRARLLAETSPLLFTSKDLKMPHSTAPISWWYPAVHSVGRENATQMTLSLEAEVLPRARHSEAQPKTSQCTGVGLSIALTCLSEWEQRVTHRQPDMGEGVCLCVCVCTE